MEPRDSDTVCYVLHSLLLGSPTGASLDFISTVRESFFTASFDIRRGLLNHNPPSSIRVVPFTYFPSSNKMTDEILYIFGEDGERVQAF